MTGGMTMLRPPCRCAIQSYDGQSSVLYQIIACKAVGLGSQGVADLLDPLLDHLGRLADHRGAADEAGGRACSNITA